MWGVDVNRRALQLAALNAGVAGVGNTTFCEPDEVPADVRFETIWSNPRSTSARLPCALLERWLARLAADGVAHLVVQKHLGSDSLQKWINAQNPGLVCTRISSSKSFGSSRSGDTDVRDPRGPAEPRASPVTALLPRCQPLLARDRLEGLDEPVDVLVIGVGGEPGPHPAVAQTEGA